MKIIHCHHVDLKQIQVLSKSDNSSLLVDRILNANKHFRDQDIDDTANDAGINLSCEVNIIANANDINAQTTTIEESSNSQTAVESKESDDTIIESYIGPSSKGPGKGPLPGPYNKI
jgi:hypothetical protein